MRDGRHVPRFSAFFFFFNRSLNANPMPPRPAADPGMHRGRPALAEDTHGTKTETKTHNVFGIVPSALSTAGTHD